MFDGKTMRVVVLAAPYAVMAYLAFSRESASQNPQSPVDRMEAKELKVQSLTLVGQDGAKCATLSTDAKGRGEFVLFAKDGKENMKLGFDGDETPLLSFAGRGRISIRDDRGDPRISMGLDGAGNTELKMLDAELKAVSSVHLRVDKNSQPSLSLHVPHSGAIATLGIPGEGGPYLNLTGKGDNGVGLSATEVGAIATLSDSNGKPRLGLLAKEDGSSVMLMGKDGITRTQLFITDEDLPAFTLTDSKLMPQIMFAIDKDGNPVIKDSKSKPITPPRPPRS